MLWRLSTRNTLNAHKSAKCPLVHPRAGACRRSPGNSPVETRISPHARREILHLGTPSTFVPAQCKHKLLALSKEAVIYPVLGVGLPIKRRRLDINSLVARIKIDIAHRCCLTRNGVRNIDTGEVGWDDEVHVLAWIGE